MPTPQTPDRPGRSSPHAGEMLFTRRRWGVIAATSVCLLMAGMVEGAEGHWAAVAEETVAALEQAVAASRAGNARDARQAILTAYFGVFEDRKMEAALRKELGQAHTVAVEERFNALRKAVAAGADPGPLAQAVAELAAVLRDDGRQLDALGVPAQVYGVR